MISIYLRISWMNPKRLTCPHLKWCSKYRSNTISRSWNHAGLFLWQLYKEDFSIDFFFLTRWKATIGRDFCEEWFRNEWKDQPVLDQSWFLDIDSLSEVPSTLPKSSPEKNLVKTTFLSGKVTFQGRTVKLREGKMWVVSWVSGFHELYWGMPSSHGLGEWTSLVSEWGCMDVASKCMVPVFKKTSGQSSKGSENFLTGNKPSTRHKYWGWWGQWNLLIGIDVF